MTLFTRQHLSISKPVYQGSVISLCVDTLNADGQEAIREVVEHPGGVVIAAQPSPDEVILVKQYRYSIDSDLIELPAGRIEPNEPPLYTAKRELIEETGYEAKQWSPLIQMYSAPGFCNEVLHVFQAQDIAFVGKNLDPDEETEVIILPLKEAWQWVINQEIRDAKTIAGLSILLLNSNKLQTQN
jgi:ADP-ribose pyrophosphatase